MKEAWIARERAAAVREAARRWRSAGAIDAETESRVAAAYPDPRFRPSWALRALTFVLVSVVVLAALLAAGVSAHGSVAGLGLLCVLFGAVCLGVTDAQEASPRLACRGGAGATAFWAGALLVGGGALLAYRPFRLGDAVLIDGVLLLSALVWGTACRRWGSPAWAVLSSVSVFLLLARAPFGRIACVAVGALVALAASRGLDTAAWAPSHRASAAAVQLVALAAVYAAVNAWSVETRWFERLRAGYEWTPTPGGRLAAAAFATAFVTGAVLAEGVRTRRTLLIDAGIVLTALSLATLRHFVRLGPLWAILVAAGVASLALALALNRWLSRGPGRERDGFTAEPLFSDESRARLLQVIPVAAALTPPAPESSVPPGGPFTPGGGSFGGGGASGRL